eukprot:6443447-Karenia_brevis.AAC.1
MLKANMKDKATTTSTELKALLEDSIDVIKVKPSKKKVSFGKEESVAYMNFLPPEPSDEVTFLVSRAVTVTFLVSRMMTITLLGSR